MSVREVWNLECPKCNSDETLDIVALIAVRLTAEGTDAYEARDTSHEWDGTNACSCECGWSGTVRDATLRWRRFDSTGEAYDAVQCDVSIENGDTLIIESEQVIGLAYTWPVAVTVTSGNLHEVADPSFITDTFTREQVSFAVAEAQHRGWPLAEHFACSQ